MHVARRFLTCRSQFERSFNELNILPKGFARGDHANSQKRTVRPPNRMIWEPSPS